MRRSALLKPVLLALATASLCAAAFGCASQRTTQEDLTPRWIKVVPESTELSVGEAVRFFAFGVTDEGREIALDDVTWTAGEGRIAPDGLYTATGPTVTTVAARRDGVAGHTSVKVRAASDPKRLEIFSPAGPVTAASRVRFFARVVESGGGERTVPAAWSASAGRVAADGTYTAPSRAGEDRLTATAEGLTAFRDVTVAPDAAVVLWVKPSNPTIRFDEGIQFKVFGVDRFGNTFPADAWLQATSGLIDREGGYRPAPDTTTADILAQSGNVSGRATVTVTR